MCRAPARSVGTARLLVFSLRCATGFVRARSLFPHAAPDVAPGFQNFNITPDEACDGIDDWDVCEEIARSCYSLTKDEKGIETLDMSVRVDLTHEHLTWLGLMSICFDCPYVGLRCV